MTLRYVAIRGDIGLFSGMRRRTGAVRYRIDYCIRTAMRFVLRNISPQNEEQRAEFKGVKKILVVRASFRLGDTMFAVPALLAVRKRYPTARIDFVGGPFSKSLFKDLWLDNFFTLTKRFPNSSWYYPHLLWLVRSVGYDLAVDVSCSQSAMGAVLVVVSGARYRVGTKGKWDQGLNVRVPKSPKKNKYAALEHFLQHLGLKSLSALPWFPLSPEDRESAKAKMDALCRNPTNPTVGVFVGGRKTWGKRWSVENFCEVIRSLSAGHVNVIVFTGPEENDVRMKYRYRLRPIPVVFEPSLTKFAAMLSHCDLVLTSDSGPVHLAYSLGVKTIAIFLQNNIERWAPAADLCRVLCRSDDINPQDVLYGLSGTIISVGWRSSGMLRRRCWLDRDQWKTLILQIYLIKDNRSGSCLINAIASKLAVPHNSHC